MEEILALLPAECPPAQTHLQIADVGVFEECLLRLEMARREAEFNILEETDEDSGM
jgi:hypothetical protein